MSINTYAPKQDNTELSQTDNRRANNKQVNLTDNLTFNTIHTERADEFRTAANLAARIFSDCISSFKDFKLYHNDIEYEWQSPN